MAAAEKRLAGSLDGFLDNLQALANGGLQVVEEEWAGKATLTVGRGANAKLLYPDAGPEEVVLVRRKVVHLAPDRQANEYLVNRVMGKPAEQVYADVESGGKPLKVLFGIDPSRVLGKDKK